jgi:transcriptional regulator with XRE-family HTH domain
MLSRVLRVRELREAKGISQEKLAALADLSSKTVRRAESGDSVSFRTLTKLARALGVEPPDLFAKPEREAS